MTTRAGSPNYLVEHGFRFQLKSGNPLTGQLYVALDYFPDAPKATIDWTTSPPELPAIPRTLQSLQDSVTRLLAKLNSIPFEGIGNDARTTLRTTNALISQINSEVVPKAKNTLNSAQTALDSANNMLQPDSSLQQSTEQAMQEMTRTAATLRTLADYLARHPEALSSRQAGGQTMKSAAACFVMALVGAGLGGCKSPPASFYTLRPGLLRSPPPVRPGQWLRWSVP